MKVCEAALERGVFAQAIRPPTVPEGTSRLRLAVMASHTRGELREAAQTLAARGPGGGLPARRGRADRRRARRRPRPRGGARRVPDARARSGVAGAARRSSSPGPTPGSARPWWPRRSPRRCGPGASGWRRSSRCSPAPTSRPTPGWPPDDGCCRRGGHGARAVAPPLRPAGLAAPGRRAGRRADRARGAGGAARAAARRGADASSSRASAACSCRSRPGYSSATTPASSACRSWSRPARARHDQPHAAHARGGARGRRWSSRAVVLTPWPDGAERDGALQPRRRSSASAASPSRTLPRASSAPTPTCSPPRALR